MAARACVMLRAMDSLFNSASSVFLAARRRRAIALASASLGLALAACEPPRMLLSDTGVSQPDAEPMDSGVIVDTGVTVDTGVRRDVAMDSSDASRDCDFELCDQMCTAAGAIVGRCMANVCNCVFAGMDGSAGTDSSTPRDSSTAADVTRESSIRSCNSNDECPPTMFCSAPSCMGPGQCALRQETDPNRCLPDPMPSCGCDGLLYPSACARTAVGVRQDPMRRCNGDAAVLPTDAASGGG
jgi:hypothetical protein